jgi:hypothetical protein
MPASEKHDLTGLLRDWANGDQEALEKLTPRVYRELHRLAELYMAQERRNHPLQTTALINEAYIRLIQWKGESSSISPGAGFKPNAVEESRKPHSTRSAFCDPTNRTFSSNWMRR